ncbi:hypothetical protein, partial [Burkholderia cenocepacia]|uniref:hypothetical protein n=1 Tax=Burkholderia cenocepacia TaxID=95486 RepID=UPI001C61430B
MAKLAFAPSNETSPSLARIAASTRAPLARPVLRAGILDGRPADERAQLFAWNAPAGATDAE